MNKLHCFVLLCVPICLNQVSPIACAYNPDVLASLESVRKMYPSLNLKTLLNLLESSGELLIKKEDLLDDRRAKRYTGVMPEVLVTNGMREDHEGLKDVDEKSNKYMTPRLGRDASGDNGADSQRTRPPFAPRLGKKSLPFSPRLGRQMMSSFSDQ
ncbi:uncharacterized protein LOC132266037 isoform X2 [Phlebotomus argentipes]|uniref:uncharacterized protein LOC132266037 isoform X2 n=1 Tax=Phlebotomus argentipes TaxID=94469 RepID=UPI002892AE49|nr:uncharacterized protein LOC132266037 isoform X2 [Phlebotomus argentipes]